MMHDRSAEHLRRPARHHADPNRLTPAVIEFHMKRAKAMQREAVRLLIRRAASGCVRALRRIGSAVGGPRTSLSRPAAEH